MKTTDSRERLKALIRTHTANSNAVSSATAPLAAAQPPPIAATTTVNTPVQAAIIQQNPKANWNRITIRLRAGEL